MAASPDVFRRIEKKYRLTAAKRTAVEQAIAGRLAASEAERHRVTSLYLDTPERTLTSRSLARPPFKEKLRLRAYGTVGGDALVRAFAPDGARLSDGEAATEVFLEMKRKLKGVVSKRRVGMSLGAVRLFLAGIPFEDATAAWPLAPAEEAPAATAASTPAASDGCPRLAAPRAASGTAALPAPGAPSPARQRQIARELRTFLDRYADLEPYLAVSCERVAWAPYATATAEAQADAAGGFGGDLRITFDDHLAYRDLSPHGVGEAARPWQPIIPASNSIMEVKCAGACPLWLARELGRLGAFPQSFSKCGAAALVARSLPSEPSPTPTQKGLVHA